MPLLAIGAAIGKAVIGSKVGKAVGGAVLRAGRALGAKTVGGAIARTAGGAVATAGAGAVVTRIAGGSPPPLPMLAPQGPQSPRPREGVVGRTISRVLPGGMTGREFTPVEGVERDKYGRPIAVYGERAERWQGPRGYVLVRDPNNPDAEPVFLLKGAARAMGLWSPRPKPPVSGWDMRAIQRAKAAQKRVKKLSSAVGLKCSRKGC